MTAAPPRVRSSPTGRATITATKTRSAAPISKSRAAITRAEMAIPARTPPIKVKATAMNPVSARVAVPTAAPTTMPVSTTDSIMVPGVSALVGGAEAIKASSAQPVRPAKVRIAKSRIAHRTARRIKAAIAPARTKTAAKATISSRAADPKAATANKVETRAVTARPDKAIAPTNVPEEIVPRPRDADTRLQL